MIVLIKGVIMDKDQMMKNSIRGAKFESLTMEGLVWLMESATPFILNNENDGVASFVSVITSVQTAIHQNDSVPYSNYSSLRSIEPLKVKDRVSERITITFNDYKNKDIKLSFNRGQSDHQWRVFFRDDFGDDFIEAGDLNTGTMANKMPRSLFKFKEFEDRVEVHRRMLQISGRQFDAADYTQILALMDGRVPFVIDMQDQIIACYIESFTFQHHSDKNKPPIISVVLITADDSRISMTVGGDRLSGTSPLIWLRHSCSGAKLEAIDRLIYSMQ
jgi:hypothetical protein